MYVTAVEILLIRSCHLRPLGVEIPATGIRGHRGVLHQNSETMKKCLNGVMSEGFEVVSYRGLPDDAANAMSIVGPGIIPHSLQTEIRARGHG